MEGEAHLLGQKDRRRHPICFVAGCSSASRVRCSGRAQEGGTDDDESDGEEPEELGTEVLLQAPTAEESDDGSFDEDGVRVPTWAACTPSCFGLFTTSRKELLSFSRLRLSVWVGTR